MSWLILFYKISIIFQIVHKKSIRWKIFLLGFCFEYETFLKLILSLSLLLASFVHIARKAGNAQYIYITDIFPLLILSFYSVPFEIQNHVVVTDSDNSF